MQALWMIVAALFFATMGVGVKVASASFHLTELVFYRGLIGVLFSALMMRATGTSLKTQVPMMHVWRSVVGTVSLGAWFYAIAVLPLATAMTLNYMSSVWIAAFIVGGAILYGHPERQGPLLATVLAGFAGVVMTLRPTMDQNSLFAGVIGLLSGISAAFAYMQVTALGRMGEPAMRTVFYFALASVLGGGLGMFYTGITPWTQVSWQAAAWLLPIGILATLGQWAMTRAYSHGATLVVASLQYSGIVFASIYGVVLFGDVIPLIGWLGMALIIASGVAATALRSSTIPDTPGEEH
jgi:S-adenosylmethionine uptake transporter